MTDWLNIYSQHSLIPSLQAAPDSFIQKLKNANEEAENLEPLKIQRADIKGWEFFQDIIVNVETIYEPINYSLLGSLDIDSVSARHVQAGSQGISTSLGEDYKKQGVILMDLFEALNKYPELVLRNLFSVIPLDKDKHTAMHYARLNGGLFIYVPKDVNVDKVLEVDLIQDSRFEQGMHYHILIVLEEGSKLEYFERLKTIGEEKNGFTMTTEVVIKPNAAINYMALDTLGGNTTALVQRHADVDKGGSIEWSIGAMNEGNQALCMHADLSGDNSWSNARAVTVADREQIQYINTSLTNIGKGTDANIQQYGVILDKAKITLNGIGNIEKYSKFSNAEQESRILMFTKEGVGNVNPILYIDEYEVTAGHAGSIGQVDEEQLYYLMSRGIPYDKAERLVIRGFLGAVISNMPSQATRDELVELIDDKLIKNKALRRK